MMKKRKLSRLASGKRFRYAARRVHKKNLRKRIRRGGYIL